MKALICDVCDKKIVEGYRKVKSIYYDGSLHRKEHICDDCWDKLLLLVKEEEDKND